MYRNVVRVLTLLILGLAVAEGLVLAQRGGAPSAANNANNAEWPTFGGDNTRTNANMAPTASRLPMSEGWSGNRSPSLRRSTRASSICAVSRSMAHRTTSFSARQTSATLLPSMPTKPRCCGNSRRPGFDETAAMNPQRGADNPFGAKQITNSTPVADANRQFIYAASPDGKVSKISISDGKAVWNTAVTRLPQIEKMDSPLSFVNGRVIALTAGYVGDAGTYQGHVVILDAGTGAIEHVWNSLCSDRLELMDPATCPQCSRRSGDAPASSSTRRPAICCSPPATGLTTAKRHGATP